MENPFRYIQETNQAYFPGINTFQEAQETFSQDSRVFVGNLPTGMSARSLEEQLQMYFFFGPGFNPAHAMCWVRCLAHPRRPTAFVQYAVPNVAHQAVNNFNGRVFLGRALRVEPTGHGETPQAQQAPPQPQIPGALPMQLPEGFFIQNGQVWWTPGYHHQQHLQLQQQYPGVQPCPQWLPQHPQLPHPPGFFPGYIHPQAPPPPPPPPPVPYGGFVQHQSQPQPHFQGAGSAEAPPEPEKASLETGETSADEEANAEEETQAQAPPNPQEANAVVQAPSPAPEDGPSPGSLRRRAEWTRGLQKIPV